ncbi:hypothetical protein BDV97DRAFT_202477 [Delphinella strobiligena]|nr:hypothetical protein BDV97DRAFT_202477 [Delphinella strobiligena]
MITEIEKLIKAAGFAKHSSHSVKISLTETESAVACVAKETGYQNGDLFLDCDAGGGTTDADELKVQSAFSDRIRLKQLSWMEGKAVGSAMLEIKVGKLVQEKLRWSKVSSQTVNRENASSQIRNLQVFLWHEGAKHVKSISACVYHGKWLRLS